MFLRSVSRSGFIISILSSAGIVLILMFNDILNRLIVVSVVFGLWYSRRRS
jgi:hypothetical protein